MSEDYTEHRTGPLDGKYGMERKGMDYPNSARSFDAGVTEDAGSTP